MNITLAEVLAGAGEFLTAVMPVVVLGVGLALGFRFMDFVVRLFRTRNDRSQ